MAEQSARYYDLIYQFKDYRREAEQIQTLILQHNRGARTILDVACGTAEHASFLRDAYELDGIDLDPNMIAIAKTKNPEGSYYCGDMTCFQLQKQYDAVLCLFSSIGYVRTLPNVVSAFKQIHAHLQDDGVILLEPWFTPSDWKKGFVNTISAERDGMQLTRMSYSDQRQDLSILRYYFLLGTQKGIQQWEEEHVLGLFTIEQMLGAFDQADLAAEYVEDGITGRGLYIARNKW